MSKSRILAFGFTLASLVCFSAYGQHLPERISFSASNLTLGQLIDKLEATTTYRFFYDPVHRDSLSISVKNTEATADSILSTVFDNTHYYYTIDEASKQIFITYRKQIVSMLPVGLLERNTQLKPMTAKRTAGEIPYPREDKSAPKASLENKIYVIGTRSAEFGNGKATVTGYVTISKTGEPVSGASVYIDNPRIGTVTNQFGYFVLSAPKGRIILNVSGIGIRNTRRQLALYEDGHLNVEVSDQVQSLKEVVISSDKAVAIRNVQMGVEKLSLQNIKQVPTVFGEADVLRVVLTLPGVKSVGEASTGFNVRGGATDQNLILYNDATIYNPSHFFGFFSAFNAEGVKDVELYKSSIPAYYGGRLSSVLSVNSREGNKKKITGSAGIGLLTSRVNIEGPIIKDKTSFMFGGRTTYSNWLLNNLPGKADYKNSKASFYDLDLHVSHQINDKNNVYLTGYFSNDRSNLNSDTIYSYRNQNLSLKWKHVFNNRLFGVLSGGYDGYKYNNYSDVSNEDSYTMKFDINQASAKADLNYYMNSKHTFNVGASSISYWLHPGTFTPKGTESIVTPQSLEQEKGLESAVYINDKYDINTSLSLNLGIRYSFFTNIGPKTVNKYSAGLPVETGNLVESEYYKRGKPIKSYGGPEYRLSARYALTSDFSVKAGYNTMRQYIHMLSNTTAIAPTDIWKLSDLNIKPQHGDQLSAGIYKNFKANTIEASIEGYYKHLNDYLDYKSGANLILNPHIETDVVTTKGKAYGLEFMLRKLSGKLNGWASYTYSRILLKTNDASQGELINGGEYYPGNYDKPHDFTLVGNYKFSHRYSFSFNTIYNTGRPITLPVGKYWYGDSPRLLYSNRNEYRIPDYLRVDLGFNIEGNHKVKQLTHNSFTLGVYNLTGRKNAYSTYFTSEEGVIKGYKLSIFGRPVPYINYNIRF